MKNTSAFMKACLTALMVFATIAAAPARAAIDGEDNLDLSGAKLVSDKDLGALRGGFTDPTGLILSFAVDVQTQIDGAVTFIRSIVMMPDATGQLAATSSAQLQTTNLPAGTTASIVDGGRGVFVTDAKGNTTALNQTAAGVMASIVTNTADFRNITQTLDINLVLQNVHALTSQINGNGIGSVNGVGIGAQLHNIGLGH